jgi:ribonuclease HI
VPHAKYYVVWRGRTPGVYSSWPECERQVKGFIGAEYKSFETLENARAALRRKYSDYRSKPSSLGKWTTARVRPTLPSVCVDAACSGSPGRLEYRGVNTETGQRLFKGGPFADGTNNVGEFLAIVEAMRWLAKEGLHWPIYSDSEIAIGWVLARKCNTKLERTERNRRLFEMIQAAEHDLRHFGAERGARGQSNAVPVLKWDTQLWGEIPADFGRK